MPPSPPYRAGAAASSAPEAAAPREPPPGTRRAQAAVSGGIRSAGTRERFLGGPGWPGPISGGGGAAAAQKAPLVCCSPRPLPARVTDSPRKVAFAISGERPAGPRRSCRVGGPGPVTEKRLPGAPPAPLPRQPAPPGPEDAEIDVEFSQTSQKEMYLPGHGPRRWVTDSVLGTGRRGWERGVAVF